MQATLIIEVWTSLKRHNSRFSFPLLSLQISSLVTLQLLTRVSHDDQLDAPKYKCAVSMDFICAISRCVCVHVTELQRFSFFTEDVIAIFIFQDSEF